MSACLEPVDFNAFLTSDAISGPQGIIQKNKAKVNIADDSDDFDKLTPGNGKISGLTSLRYYMLEEYDPATDKKTNYFIQDTGNKWGDLSQIGRLKGTEIIGLKNDNTYKVMYAKAFIGETAHEYFAFGDTKVRYADLSTGTVTISGVKDYYLNVGSVNNASINPVINANNGYQVMKIPVSNPDLSGTNTPWGNAKTSASYNKASDVFDITEGNYDPFDNSSGKLNGIYQYRKAVFADSPPKKLNLPLMNKSLIALTGVNTQSDYVFAEFDSNKVTKFIVLNITRLDEITVNINVDITYTSENSPAVTVTTPSTPPSSDNNYSFSQNVNQNIVISVSTPDNYAKIEWYKDDVKTPVTGTNFTFNFGNNVNDANNKQAGAHQIMAVGYKDGIPYSTLINITVTP